MQVPTEMRAIARPAPSSFPVATDFYAREVSGLPARGTSAGPKSAGLAHAIKAYANRLKESPVQRASIS